MSFCVCLIGYNYSIWWTIVVGSWMIFYDDLKLRWAVILKCCHQIIPSVYNRINFIETLEV